RNSVSAATKPMRATSRSGVSHKTAVRRKARSPTGVSGSAIRINVRSPRCLAHMANSVPDFISTLGQVLIPLNQNMAKRQASRAFSRLEEDGIIALHKLVYGFAEEFYAHYRADESSAFGLMVSGGTLANMTAIWAARNCSFGPLPGFAGIEEEGAAEALRAHGYAGAAVVGSDLMHYSFDKAMGLAGFGTRP